MFKEGEIDREFVRGGNGGMFVLDAEAPFAAAAFRLELLLVFTRPKPWRLGNGTVLVCFTLWRSGQKLNGASAACDNR